MQLIFGIVYSDL